MVIEDRFQDNVVMLFIWILKTNYKISFNTFKAGLMTKYKIITVTASKLDLVIDDKIQNNVILTSSKMIILTILIKCL